MTTDSSKLPDIERALEEYRHQCIMTHIRKLAHSNAEDDALKALRALVAEVVDGLKDAVDLLEIAIKDRSGAFANAVREEELPRFKQLLKQEDNKHG